MKQRILHAISIICILLLLAISSNAQNGASSAYTTFGVGRIESASTIKYQGMGGVGVALLRTIQSIH